MIGRIIEIAEDKRHLSLYRGFMVVKETGAESKEIGQVPIDDIAAVIGNSYGLSYSNNLLVAFAERGIPFALCAANHNVAGFLLSTNGNLYQSKRIEAQIAAKQPTHKKLWAAIIKNKLEQQASTLEAINQPSAPLIYLSKKVKSGDSENLEAQGAKKYWSLLFQNNFRRDKNADGVNSLLNYGYTILRATTARAVVAAGLHPSIGLHHSNDSNAMRLVDDLMEPFRPMIDLQVWLLNKAGKNTVNPETKRALVNVMYLDMQTTSGASPVMICLQKLATSLAQIYLGERDKLELPQKRMPAILAENQFQE